MGEEDEGSPADEFSFQEHHGHQQNMRAQAQNTKTVAGDPPRETETPPLHFQGHAHRQCDSGQFHEFKNTAFVFRRHELAENVVCEHVHLFGLHLHTVARRELCEGHARVVVVSQHVGRLQAHDEQQQQGEQETVQDKGGKGEGVHAVAVPVQRERRPQHPLAAQQRQWRADDLQG